MSSAFDRSRTSDLNAIFYMAYVHRNIDWIVCILLSHGQSTLKWLMYFWAGRKPNERFINLTIRILKWLFMPQDNTYKFTDEFPTQRHSNAENSMTSSCHSEVCLIVWFITRLLNTFKPHMKTILMVGNLTMNLNNKTNSIIDTHEITNTGQSTASPWASYQMRKIAGCACAGNARNVLPTTDFKANC